MASKKQTTQEQTLEEGLLISTNESLSLNEKNLKEIGVLESDVFRLSKDKQQLEEQIIVLKKEIERIKEDLKSLRKSNEEISSNEHTVRALNEKLNNELKEEKSKRELEVGAAMKEKILATNTLQNQIESLKNDLTKIANLFDEYINAYQDQTKMLGVFVKNTQTVEKYLSEKINEFNGGNKK